MEIQNIPVVDSKPNDAFEALVELYYQTKGYITSTGKWFWVFQAGKQQRGYQDIDLLAINGNTTVIVSVTSNLDDKIGSISSKKDDKFDNLQEFFSRTINYLSEVNAYSWLVADGRKIEKVVAFANSKKSMEAETDFLQKNNISLIGPNEIGEINDYIKQSNLKIQNEILRSIQILNLYSPKKII